MRAPVFAYLPALLHWLLCTPAAAAGGGVVPVSQRPPTLIMALVDVRALTTPVRGLAANAPAAAAPC
jgi:hypothetical protein